MISNLRATEPERRLTLNAVSGAVENAADGNETIRRILAEPHINWDYVFAYAARHGVVFLLTERLLAEFKQQLAPEIRARLERARLVITARNELLARETVKIDGQLKSLGLQPIHYKGATLSQMAYGDALHRQFGDIDLMVSRAAVSSALAALKSLGYVWHSDFSPAQLDRWLDFHWSCELTQPATGYRLDLHWRAHPPRFPIRLDLAAMRARATVITLDNSELTVFSPPDLLLLLALHAAKDFWEKLLWLCDMQRIVSTFEIDWQALFAQAEYSGLNRSLTTSLLLAQKLLNFTLPPDVRRHIASSANRPERLSNYIARRIRQDAPFPTGIRRYLLPALSLETINKRLRYAAHLALTPSPEDWTALDESGQSSKHAVLTQRLRRLARKYIS